MWRRIAIIIFLSVIGVGAAAGRGEAAALSTCSGWGACLAGGCPANWDAACAAIAPPGCIVAWSQCQDNDVIDCNGGGYLECASNIY